MNDSDVWLNYPPELLTQAQQRAAAAEQEFLAKKPCDPDPYNVPLATVITRWWARKVHG